MEKTYSFSKTFKRIKSKDKVLDQPMEQGNQVENLNRLQKK